MSRLFGKDFEGRVGLHQRQVDHSQLLEIERFKTCRIGDKAAFQPHFASGRDRAGLRSDGPLVRVLMFLVVVCFFYTIPAALVSAVGALFSAAAYAIVQTIQLRRNRVPFVDTYRASFRIIFSVLTAIFVIAIIAFH